MPAEYPIRNPAELATSMLRGAAADVGAALASKPQARVATAPVQVRRITVQDLWDSLAEGVSDLGAARADVLFIALVYPAAGLVLAQFAFRYALLPLLFPLVSGFALLGPLAAVGLYEISRRREQGLPPGLFGAFEGVMRSPALPSILALGAILLGLFLVWMGAAYLIWLATLGPVPPTSVSGFFRDALTTGPGHAMIVIGVAVGFVFAVVSFCLSVVSFPLLLDRDPGVEAAVATSVRAVAANPGPMALWGAIVAGGLVLGSLPALAGLVVIMPVLGHATWRLYRKLVA